MSDLNSVTLIGRLCDEPELREFQSGNSVCKARIASNRKYRKGEETVEEVLYINVESWGGSAKFLSSYGKKGRRISVQGRLKMDTWEAKDGTKRSEIVISAMDINFLDNDRDEDGGGGGQRSSGRQQRAGRQQRGRQQRQNDEYGDEGNLPF